jgi:signal peptidase I
MVDTLLIVISIVSLVIWFVQEKVARKALQENLDKHVASDKHLAFDQLQSETMPSWNEWLFRVIFLIWMGWVAGVVLIKDGDFAFVLVILTLLSGVIVGLDKLLFEKSRQAYINSKAVVDYLSKYAADQRESLRQTFGADMVVGEYARSFFPVLALVLVLRSFIIEPFQIPSASMVPTLEVGDYILVNKFKYGLRLPVLGTKIIEIGEPERGDIMVFFPPDDPRYFIKRVIGLPGDQIVYADKQLTINGKAVPQKFLAELNVDRNSGYTAELNEEQYGDKTYNIHNMKNVFRGDFSVTVEPGHYFMMGDNRDNSSDSRVWGQVPEENIVGQAFAIWMHWGALGELPSFSRVGGVQ